MNNKLLLLLVLLLFTIKIFAQEQKISKEFNITVSKEFEKTSLHLVDWKTRVFKWNNRIFHLKQDDNDLILSEISKTDLIKKEIQKFEDFFSKFSLYNFVQMKDKIYFFYEEWNRKSKVESLEYNSLSLSSLKLTERKVLISQQGKITRDYLKYNKFYIKTSKSKDKLLIYYSLSERSKKENNSKQLIYANLFDLDLKLLWQRMEILPYSKEKIKIHNCITDYDQKMYFLTSINENGINNRKQLDTHLTLFESSKNQGELIEYKYDLKNKLIGEVDIYKRNENDFVIVGTFKNPKYKEKGWWKGKGQIELVFGINFNNEKGLHNLKEYNFPLEFMKLYKNENEKNKIDRIIKKYNKTSFLNNFNISSVKFLEDGSYLMFGDIQYIKVKGKDAIRSNHYNDIIILKASNKGELNWRVKIGNKPSASSDFDGDISFKYNYYNNQHYFFYIAALSPKNSDRKKIFLKCAKINDATGAFEEKPIFNTDKYPDKINFYNISQSTFISKNEMLIDVFRPKEFFVKITMK